MAVLCIGGSGSGAGKTAIGCELIRAMPELRWMAIKVSPHWHDDSRQVVEETDVGSGKDTSEYLAAGAKRAFLISAGEGVLGCVRHVRVLANECDAVLVETGGLSAAEIALPGECGVTLAVLAADAPEWKAGTLQRAQRADALVLLGGADRCQLPLDLQRKLSFVLAKEKWISETLSSFVRERLSETQA